MAQDFLLEIGTEEIPAGFLQQAYTDIAALAADLFSRQRLACDGLRVLGTPRRLALLVSGLAERQDDQVTERLGPARNIAFDADGNPTKAAIGFARGQGIPVEEIEVVNTGKGEYICARRSETGRDTIAILAEQLPAFIQGLPFRKSMRWRDLDLRFARPIHWLVALLGTEVVPFTLENLVSGNRSRGHRFMAPAEFVIDTPAAYIERCREAMVMVDPAERRQAISDQLAAIEKEASGTVIADPELLETVTNLVEYPAAARGGFDEEFLALPEEVLITVMRHHQKYFSLRGVDGRLLPCFVTINNTKARNPALVVAGNERVLRARLNDANFFYADDLKVPLETFAERLRQVVFQARLGTSYEKMERFRTIAEWLADRFHPAERGLIGRTAYLCKADLESGMVYEFPDLQGIMGREYARAGGEDEAVSRGIFEHYLPTASGGDLPSGPCGALVSIADKIDTIAGCFAIGLTPTGGADPYALRRQALGIIHIILDRGYRLRLTELIGRALDLLAAKSTRPREETAAAVLDFFRGRFTNNLTARGIPSGVVEAVVSTDFDDLVTAYEKITALDAFRTRDDFELLLAAFKRVMNIIRTATLPTGTGVDPESKTRPQAPLFREEAERNLFTAFNRAASDCGAAIDSGDYQQALAIMADLKPAVDGFFDQVMVMDENEAVRTNRLALLTGIATLFTRVADFARL
ncbi:MAG: glycine--tRNA ligase subunit beta [Deltaproteobacteria bacterium]|nr:glycine--tRNA ligase subunit beta [Candidatus Anaeroferrophillacea bacterium]